jgi:hypothetical protein
MIALAVAWLVPTVALAHETGGVLDIRPADVRAGDRVRLAGGEAKPGESVSVLVFGPDGQRPIGSATSDEHGDFELDATVPGDLASGSYNIRVFGAAGPISEGVVRVTASPLGGALLPVLAALGAVLALVGGAVLVTAQRRRAPARAPVAGHAPKRVGAASKRRR